LDGLLSPFLLAFCSIADFLLFVVPRHIPVTGETPMPVEAAMAALAIEGVSGISGGRLKLTAAMAAVVLKILLIHALF
jgi:hypothetical protein